ncbi:MAG TPA: gamma-glutamyltransferase, partial [Aurantimonas sp.]
MFRISLAALLSLSLFLAPFALAQEQATDAIQPEIASEASARTLVEADRQMVAAANPVAAEAGLAILRQGG